MGSSLSATKKMERLTAFWVVRRTSKQFQVQPAAPARQRGERLKSEDGGRRTEGKREELICSRLSPVWRLARPAWIDSAGGKARGSARFKGTLPVCAIWATKMRNISAVEVPSRVVTRLPASGSPSPPGRHAGHSPDTHGSLAVDNFQPPGGASSLRWTRQDKPGLPPSEGCVKITHSGDRLPSHPKPPGCDIKATSRPVDSQAVATPKPPQSAYKATLKPP